MLSAVWKQTGALEPVLLDCPKKLKHSVPCKAALLQQDSLAEPMLLWVKEGTILQKEGKQKPQKRKQCLSLQYTVLVAEVGSPVTNEEAMLAYFWVIGMKQYETDEKGEIASQVVKSVFFSPNHQFRFTFISEAP